MHGDTGSKSKTIQTIFISKIAVRIEIMIKMLLKLQKLIELKKLNPFE